MKVNKDLVYEIGRLGNNQNELIISGGGMKKVFNSVLALIRTAPSNLDNWRFIAFRDRKRINSHHCISYGGKSYSHENIRFALSMDEHIDKIGIWLFMKGFDGEFVNLDATEREFYHQIGYLYLDAILDEYTVEMHVGEILFLSQNDSIIAERNIETYPMTDLARQFDGWLAEKIGPKPKGGWSALANLGCPLEVGAKKSPTGVDMGGFDN